MEVAEFYGFEKRDIMKENIEKHKSMNTERSIKEAEGHAVLSQVINWLTFADDQPVHDQPIVYWRSGYRIGVWNNETKTMCDGSHPPKVWYPLPTCL